MEDNHHIQNHQDVAAINNDSPFISEESHLSPLEQIRHAEAEVTRQLASARQLAEKKLTKTRYQAAQQQKQAREEGQQQGQAHYQIVVDKAKEEARQILAESRSKADALLLQGEACLQEAVCHAMDIILGLEGNEKTDLVRRRRKRHEH